MNWCSLWTWVISFIAGSPWSVVLDFGVVLFYFWLKFTLGPYLNYFHFGPWCFKTKVSFWPFRSGSCFKCHIGPTTWHISSLHVKKCYITISSTEKKRKKKEIIKINMYVALKKYKSYSSLSITKPLNPVCLHYLHIPGCILSVSSLFVACLYSSITLAGLHAMSSPP